MDVGVDVPGESDLSLAAGVTASVSRRRDAAEDSTFLDFANKATDLECVLAHPSGLVLVTGPICLQLYLGNPLLLRHPSKHARAP